MTQATKEITVKVNSKIFNTLTITNTRFVVSYGGAGSGKRYKQTQFEKGKGLKKRETILIFRKFGKTLNDSVVRLIKEGIENFGILGLI